MGEVANINSGDFPIIIKPAIKKTPEINVVKEAFRVKICQNKGELQDAANQLRSLDQEGIVQQYIPGGDNKLCTIGTYSFNGELIAWSTCKKIRQFPPITGECSLGKTIYKPELVQPATDLLKGLSLTGISQIEFKEYEGNYYLIEINPRIWSWHQLNATNQVNLTQICLDYLRGKITKGTTFEPSKEENYWQFFWMDLLHNRLLNKNASFFEILQSFFKSNQEAFYYKKDFKVFWQHTKRTLPYIKRQYNQGKAK